MTPMTPMNRTDVTELIVTTRLQRGITWAAIAEAVGRSKEWVTAACLGQMALSSEQAAAVVGLLDLPPEDANTSGGELRVVVVHLRVSLVGASRRGGRAGQTWRGRRGGERHRCC